MDKYNFKEFTKLRGQRFACLNIRSLYANHSLLEIDLMGSEIYTLGLVETWLKPHTLSGILKIEGFDLIRLDRDGPKRGGGVGCYIRNDLQWEYMEDMPETLISNGNIELLTIKVIRLMQKPLLLSIIYIPPKASLNVALDHLDTVADKIISTKLDWILMGDFNVNLVSNNHQTSKLKNFASHNYLYQLIRASTRITLTTQSLLDHIYTNINPEHTKAYVIKYGLSDHDMIGIVIKKPMEPVSRESFTCRSHSRYTIHALKTALDDCDWSNFDNMATAEDGWDMLYNNYILSLNAIAPFVTMDNVKKRKSWTTPELLQKIRQRDSLKSKADALLNNTAYQEFKKTKNKIKREVIKAKRSFIMSKINASNNNPKQYWAELNSTFNPKNLRPDDSIRLSHNGLDVDKEETADYMNDYFSNVGQMLASKINIDNTEYLNTLKNLTLTNCNKLISWRPTNPEELERLINNIDIYKSSKVKDISSKYFKDCLLSSIDKVCILFNRIFLDGKFPDSWKEATIVPIFKKGNSKMVQNYLPISLLPIIGKLMEKLIHTRLYNFLDDIKYFSPSQGGFRPERGTTDTISTMLDYIYERLNYNTITAAVFFDLSKAFDSIDQNILILKLESAGIAGSCLKLLKDYLNK